MSRPYQSKNLPKVSEPTAPEYLDEEMVQYIPPTDMSHELRCCVVDGDTHREYSAVLKPRKWTSIPKIIAQALWDKQQRGKIGTGANRYADDPDKDKDLRVDPIEVMPVVHDVVFRDREV